MVYSHKCLMGFLQQTFFFSFEKKFAPSFLTNSFNILSYFYSFLIQTLHVFGPTCVELLINCLQFLCIVKCIFILLVKSHHIFSFTFRFIRFGGHLFMFFFFFKSDRHFCTQNIFCGVVMALIN